MKLSLIIKQLRTYCPTFVGNVAGAAEFKHLQESANLPLPCAFVIPIDDSPGDNRSQNGTRQDLTDSFAVIVAFTNTHDERGQAATDAYHTMRAELWAALLGFRPSDDGESCNSIYKGIQYEGGHLLKLDRARAWYQFEFGADMEIGNEDGWQRIENANLVHLDGITIHADFKDPKPDPYVRDTDPQTKVENEVRVPKSGNFP